MVKANDRWGTSVQTCWATQAALSLSKVRFSWQLGQAQRPRHENATNISCWLNRQNGAEDQPKNRDCRPRKAVDFYPTVVSISFLVRPHFELSAGACSGARNQSATATST